MEAAWTVRTVYVFDVSFLSNIQQQKCSEWTKMAQEYFQDSPDGDGAYYCKSRNSYNPTFYHVQNGEYGRYLKRVFFVLSVGKVVRKNT